MIERAIENWLISTNERNFQVPFCQVLMKQGHDVLYISSHRPMEQGKDIITINSSGVPCAFQLKTGNINLRGWREIKGEIQELIELPIVHASVDKVKPFKSFLVTNGKIIDEVRILIDQMNEDNKRKNRQYSYLETIEGPSLVKQFVDAQKKFIPKNLEDFRSFLELFLADGRDFLSKEQFFKFLQGTIFNTPTGRRSDKINAISSSVVIAGYSLSPFQEKQNHFAQAEAWTILAGLIIQYSSKAKLKKNEWEKSLSLVELEICRNLIALRGEALGRTDFLEGEPKGDGGQMYRARATIILGALSALEIYLHNKEKKHDFPEDLTALIKKYAQEIIFWGESAFPFFFWIIKYLEMTGNKSDATKLCKGLFNAILEKNALREENGFASPYYSAHDVLAHLMDIEPGKIDFSQFCGRSYILRTLVEMLARRGEKALLQANWRRISHILFSEIVPDDFADLFLWHIDAGADVAAFPKATQKWSGLEKESNSRENIPLILKSHHHLLRFLILAYPIRATPSIIRLLDS